MYRMDLGKVKLKAGKPVMASVHSVLEYSNSKNGHKLG